MRIRLDKLETTPDGRLLFCGTPFTGVAYRVESGLVLENLNVTDGIVTGPAEDWDPSVRRVMLESLIEIEPDETDERFPEPGSYFEGKIFEGIVYEFNQVNGALLSETIYNALGPSAGREWYSSGTLRGEIDRVREDGSCETEYWHENGQRASLSMDRFIVSYTEAGRLRVLSLWPDYPTDELEHVSFRADAMLHLSGEGVTDAIVARLTCLEDVNDLSLDGTSITQHGLQRFRDCSQLTKFETKRNKRFSADDVRQLLAVIPNCEWLDYDTLLANLEREARK